MAGEKGYLNEKLICFSDGGVGGSDFIFNIGQVTKLPAGAEPTVHIEQISNVNFSLSFGLPEGEKGDQGTDGNIPSISIGTVTTLDAGSEATASLTKDSSNNLKLNLGIPRGESGLNAVPPTLKLGNVSTGAQTDATITYNEETNEYTLDVSLVKGDKGNPGESPIIRNIFTTYLPAGSIPTSEMVRNDNEYTITIGIPVGYDGQNGRDGIDGQDGITPTFTAGTVEMLEEGEQPYVRTDMVYNEENNTNDYTINIGIPKSHQGVDGINGKDGVDGTLPELTIGTVETIEHGNNAEVNLVKSDTNYTFNFKLPKGRDGTNGAIPTFEIGDVETLEPDHVATASFTEDGENHYKLNIGIPSGTSAITPTLRLGDVGRLGADEEPSIEIVLVDEEHAIYNINMNIPVGSKGPKGEKGDDGLTPTFSIGTVTALDYTEEPQVTMVKGDNNDYTVNFKIPRGQDGEIGEKGKDAVLNLSSVQTLEPGDQATASLEFNSETSTDITNVYDLTLGIPKGTPGQDADAALVSNNLDDEMEDIPSSIGVVNRLYHNSGAFNTKEIYTTSTTFTPTETGIHRITLVGGGGGGAAGYKDETYCYGGGGGGGGECYQFLVKLSKDETYNIIIGAGGSGSSTHTDTNKGSNGGKTQFITSAKTYQANGGTGGYGQTGGSGGVTAIVDETRYGGDTGTNGTLGLILDNMYGLSGKGGCSGQCFGAAGIENALPTSNGGGGGAGGSCSNLIENNGQNGASGRVEIEYSYIDTSD